MMFYNTNIAQPLHTLSNMACMSGADLPGVDVVLLAAADPAAHAGHRLDQADQHGGGGGAFGPYPGAACTTLRADGPGHMRHDHRCTA